MSCLCWLRDWLSTHDNALGAKLDALAASLETMMGQLEELQATLGRLNSATSLLGDEVAKVAADQSDVIDDLNKLLALVQTGSPDAAALQQIVNDLSGAVGTLEANVATLQQVRGTLDQTAALFPPVA